MINQLSIWLFFFAVDTALFDLITWLHLISWLCREWFLLNWFYSKVVWFEFSYFYFSARTYQVHFQPASVCQLEQQHLHSNLRHQQCQEGPSQRPAPSPASVPALWSSAASLSAQTETAVEVWATPHGHCCHPGNSSTAHLKPARGS